MKLAIYIENGIKQIALTPENRFEKKIFEDLEKTEYDLTIKKGDFYECEGGRVR